MKVIKKGRADRIGWKRELSCTGKGNDEKGCGALLQVEFHDLYKTYRSYYDGETDTFITFMCPECGTQTDIGWTELGKMRWYHNQIGNMPPEMKELREKLIKGEKKHG